MANESSEFPTLGFLFSTDIQCAKKARDLHHRA